SKATAGGVTESIAPPYSPPPPRMIQHPRQPRQALPHDRRAPEVRSYPPPDPRQSARRRQMPPQLPDHLLLPVILQKRSRQRKPSRLWRARRDIQQKHQEVIRLPHRRRNFLVVYQLE